MNKQLIERRFSAAAQQYQQHASQQAAAAQQLLNYLPEDFHAQHVLDLGCGPGSQFLTLRQRANTYTGIDIAAAMLSQAQQTYNGGSWLKADFEDLPLANDSADWVFANFSLQWAEDFSQVLREIRRVVMPGGRITINTLAAGTFSSLRSSALHATGSPRVMRFAEVSLLHAQVAAVFPEVEMHLRTEQQHFPTLTDAMRSIRGVGASYHGVSERGLLTPRQLKRWQQQAQKATGNDNQISLEWQILDITGSVKVN